MYNGRVPNLKLNANANRNTNLHAATHKRSMQLRLLHSLAALTEVQSRSKWNDPSTQPTLRQNGVGLVRMDQWPF